MDKETKVEKNKEITMDDLFRLRASSDIANMNYIRTGRKDIPFAVHKKGFTSSPIAYFGNEDAVKLFCSLNEIINMAINAQMQADKLQKQLNRSNKNPGIMF